MAYGFEAVRAIGGTPARMNTFMDYTVASNYGTALYTGDPVKLVAAGNIERCAAGDVPVGVFAGAEWTDPNTGEIKFSKYVPATSGASDVKAYVYDDPYIVFKIEADQAADPLVLADRGLNADVVAGSGSNFTGLSGFALDSSTADTTNTLVYRLTGSAEDGGTFTLVGVPMDVYVVHNLHFWKNSTTGV